MMSLPYCIDKGTQVLEKDYIKSIGKSDKEHEALPFSRNNNNDQVPFYLEINPRRFIIRVLGVMV